MHASVIIALLVPAVSGFAPLRTPAPARRLSPLPRPTHLRPLSSSEAADPATAASLQEVAEPAPLGGRVVVTGLEDDASKTELFMLELLNRQAVWDPIVAVTPDVASAKKRLISRQARYSGLLDKLDFVPAGGEEGGTDLAAQLEGCTAWVCLSAPFGEVESYLRAAASAGVRRAVVTTRVPEESRADGAADEGGDEGATALFPDTVAEVAALGLNATVLGHGDVVPAAEGGAYKVVRGGLALPNATAASGDVARVAVELLQLSELSTTSLAMGRGNDTHMRYLRYVRGKGVSRGRELSDMVAGGIRRYEYLQSDEYKEKLKQQREEKKKRENALYRAEADKQAKYREQRELMEEAQRERAELQPLADKILMNEWQTLRMTKRTRLTMPDYMSQNQDRGMQLARQAVEDESALTSRSRAENDFYEVNYDDDQYDATEEEMIEELQLRKRYKRLLALEEALTLNQRVKQLRESQYQQLVEVAKQAAEKQWSDEVVQKYVDSGGDYTGRGEVEADDDEDDAGFDDEDNDGITFDIDDDAKDDTPPAGGKGKKRDDDDD